MHALETILSGIPKLRALVVGDVCLDRWCRYDPALNEPSRETGIPRTAVIASELTPGAAGTVANNLAALGVGEVAVLGVIGEDGNGWELRQALDRRGIAHDRCVRSSRFCTFTYTKLLNAQTGEEDLARVDYINVTPLPEAEEAQLVAGLNEAIPHFDVILISDQAETHQGGVVTGKVRDAINAQAAANPGKVVWVDSRRRPEKFRHVIVKPNEDEANAALDRLGLPRQYRHLLDITQSPFLPVTHGDRGALLLDAHGETWVPTTPVANPVDICGAGDSFSAGASLAYAITKDPVTAIQFGNLVASITIMKKGTGTASPSELRQALHA